MGIRQRFKDIHRIRHILAVLIKYGFGYIVDRLNIERSVVGRRILEKTVGGPELLEMPAPVRLRRALEELGPTFVKMGQILSMRPDLVPASLVEELEKLQDEVPGFGIEEVRAQVLRELHRPIEELYACFDPEPLASASLAQVHAARLFGGDSVVVKVQRPGVEELINTDIEILYELAALAYRYVEESRLFDPVGIVDEFKRTIARELDFVEESFNIEKFGEQFRDDPTVKIPKVYPELSCRRVLTMERLRGVKINDLPAIEAAGLDRRLLAKRGTDAFLKQVFVNGFFHADPHAGNILALDGNRVAFLDFGMVGRLTPAMKQHLGDVLIGIERRDVAAIRDSFLTIGTAGENVDVQNLDLELQELLDHYYDRPLRELNAGEIFINMINLVSRHHIRLPSELFLLAKTILTVDGIGRTLDEDFNLVEEARPFVEDLEWRRYSPRKVLHDLRRFAVGFTRFARALPRDLTEIFAKLKKGTLKVEFEHMGLENLNNEIDKASSRISFSLIIAALIVGSSIITVVGRGPQFHGLSLIGIFGFIVAAILGLWLAIVILSSGKI